MQFSSLHAAVALLILPLCNFTNAVEPVVLPLWENGAPGFEARKNEPEVAKDWWVKNIHNPTLTIHQPDEANNKRVGIIICPGGGHRLLVANAEGNDAGKLLAEKGFTCFVLKYRLGREENSPYKIDVHALEDGQRAMRLVRDRADELKVDPNKIGMLGFSAGGEVVSMVAFADDKRVINKVDDVDSLSSKPDFIMQVYPGPLGIPESVDATAPPAFLVTANDDGASKNIIRLMELYCFAKVQVETHIFASGGHGFNLGQRSKLKTISTWPERMIDWLDDYVVE